MSLGHFGNVVYAIDNNLQLHNVLQKHFSKLLFPNFVVLFTIFECMIHQFFINV